VIGTDIVNPDFVGFAAAYGFPAESVRRTEDFGAALDRALAAPGSALIELVTEADVITARTTLTRLRQAALARQG
jgi:acetolactate synthase-1/2/3 large subunit